MIAPARLLGRVLFIALFGIVFTACKDKPTDNDQPPGQPANITAVPVDFSNATAVQLAWNAPADSASVAGYRVWWQAAPAGAKDSADVDASKRTYSITGLHAGQGYVFSVAARRGGRFSAVSTLSWAGVSYPAAPLAPHVTFPSSTTAHIAWAAAADTGITGYRISWRKSSQVDSSATDVPASAGSADITNLDWNTAYTFQVQSKRGSLLSAAVSVQWTAVPQTPPSRPSGLLISPLGSTSVQLSWQPSSDTGAITYRVAWSGKNVVDSGSMETPASNAVVTGLKTGKSYAFNVTAVRGGAASSPIALDGAPASRFVNDVSGGTLKMYEQASPYNSTMILDPSLGGPKRVSANYQPLGSIQLAIYTSSADPSIFSIGPAYAFVEYRNASQFDQNVFTSDSSYPALSLDAWNYTGSIEPRIPQNGNLRAFDFPVSQLQNMGQGFFIRTGSAGDYHYARLLVKNVGGKLLQGDAPNRYAELEISYQTAANTAFAKANARGMAVANIASRPRR